MIEAVVFDVDGTLLDTRELIRVGYVETLRAHGFAQEAERLQLATVSKPVRESYRSIIGNRISESRMQLMLTHHEHVQNAAVEHIIAYKGLQDVLQVLRERPVAVGIFTSGSMWHVERNFKQVGIDPKEMFDAIVTSDDKVAHKPAPDGLLLCLKKLGEMAPAAAVMVGDHPADMQVGRSAEVCASIGVLHGLGSHEQLDAAGADYLIPSLAELSPTLDIIEQYG